MVSEFNENNRLGIDFSTAFQHDTEILRQKKHNLHFSSSTTPLHFAIENEDSREPSYNSTLLAEGEGRIEFNSSLQLPIQKSQQSVKFKHKMKNVKINFHFFSSFMFFFY